MIFIATIIVTSMDSTSRPANSFLSSVARSNFDYDFTSFASRGR